MKKQLILFCLICNFSYAAIDCLSPVSDLITKKTESLTSLNVLKISILNILKGSSLDTLADFPLIIWLDGPSHAGKTKISKAIYDYLPEHYNIDIIDIGDRSNNVLNIFNKRIKRSFPNSPHIVILNSVIKDQQVDFKGLINEALMSRLIFSKVVVERDILLQRHLLFTKETIIFYHEKNLSDEIKKILPLPVSTIDTSYLSEDDYNKIFSVIEIDSSSLYLDKRIKGSLLQSKTDLAS